MHGECLLHIKSLVAIVTTRAEFKRGDISSTTIKIHVYALSTIACSLHTTSSFIRTISTIIFVVANISRVNTRAIGALESKSRTCWSSWTWCSWRRSCWDWSSVRSTELRHGQVINGNISLVARTADTFNNNLSNVKIFYQTWLRLLEFRNTNCCVGTQSNRRYQCITSMMFLANNDLEHHHMYYYALNSLTLF